MFLNFFFMNFLYFFQLFQNARFVPKEVIPTYSNQAGQVVECQICGKQGHNALDCPHQNNFSYQDTAPTPSLTAMQAQAPFTFLPQDLWIVDIGVSHHMTADVNSLQDVTFYQGTDKITIGNGEGCQFSILVLQNYILCLIL